MTVRAAVADLIQTAFATLGGAGDSEPIMLRSKPTMPPPTEHAIQSFVFEVLAANEPKYPFLKWIFSVPNGGARDIRVAVKLKREGVKRGVADIALPLPRGQYHGAVIEQKTKGGRLSVEQKEFLAFMESQGYRTFVSYSADESLRFIEEYLGIRLSR